MNRTECVDLLRLRRQLTNENFSDDTVDAWMKAVHGITYADADDAMVAACRKGRVALHDLCEHVPKRPLVPTPPLEPFEPLPLAHVAMLWTAGVAVGRAERLARVG